LNQMLPRETQAGAKARRPTTEDRRPAEKENRAGWPGFSQQLV
jgi:hypothetical protein